MGVPYVSDLMDYIDSQQQYADPRTKNWFMFFGSPVPVWLLSAIYLLIVVTGPRFMKNRPAYSLKSFMLLYNIALVILSLYMCVELFLSTSIGGYNWMCMRYNKDTWKDPKEYRIASVLWVYSISKSIEFMDTFLMILRKKEEQVTFLHVFHHVTMVNIWWWVPVFSPGGLVWFCACLNSLVHVVMYTYYGLAAFPALKPYLWWKRYITKMQLMQFVLIFFHTVYNYMVGCDFPMWGLALLTSYMVIMLSLFANFYYHSYKKGKKRAQIAKAKKTDFYDNGPTEKGDADSSLGKSIRNGLPSDTTRAH